jgi:hypothetical protein
MLQGGFHCADTGGGILPGHARQRRLFRPLGGQLHASERLHGGLWGTTGHGARLPQGGLHHTGIGGGTLPGHAR